MKLQTMFKPKSLKEAISLERMRDEQLTHKNKYLCPFSETNSDSSPIKASPIKRFNWDEMQKKRTSGLCFNCDEKFVPRRKCKGPQLLLLEGTYVEDETNGQLEP